MFDAVISMSAIEHFGNDGDIAPVREIERVLVPGGRACITLPYTAKYFEEWLSNDPYGHQVRRDGKVFFARWYDYGAVHSRLLSHTAMRVLDWSALQEPYEGRHDRIVLWLARLERVSGGTLRGLGSFVASSWWVRIGPPATGLCA